MDQFYFKLRITGFCRESCTHCPDSRLVSKSTDSLTLGDVQATLKRIERTHSPATVTLLLTGGEPLDSARFSEILRLTCLWKPRHLILATNGLALLEQPALFDTVIATPPDEVWLSTEFSPEAYRRLRQRADGFERAQEVARIWKQRDPALLLTWNVTYSGEDPNVLDDFIQNMRQVPMDSIRVMRMKQGSSQDFVASDEKWKTFTTRGQKLQEKLSRQGSPVLIRFFADN